MLDAKKARELAEKNRISNIKAKIEKQIRKAVEAGRDYIVSMEAINDEITQKLSEAGYKVEQQISGTKISW